MPDDLQEAKRLAKAGRKAEARQIASRIIRKEKDNVAAWVVLAQVVNTREQAIDCLKQVLRLEPGHPWATIHLSRLTQQAEARSAPPPPPPPAEEPEPAWADLDTPSPPSDAMSDLLGDIPSTPTARAPDADLDPLSGTTPWRRPSTSMDVDTFDALRAEAAGPSKGKGRRAAAPGTRRIRWLPLALLFVIFVVIGAGLICAMQMGLLGGAAPAPADPDAATGSATAEPTGEAPGALPPAATEGATEPPDAEEPTEQPTPVPTEEATATSEPTGEASSTASGATGEIAFAREIGGGTELFVMSRDGSGQTQITSGAIVDAALGMDWSPDGRRIVFVASADEDGDGSATGDIFIVNADGSGLLNLTQSPADDLDPQWSPDGRYIAFVTGLEGYSIGIAEANPPSLPATVTLGPEGGQPSWSPDSAYIAFSTGSTGTRHIFVLDVACTLGEMACAINPTQLTTDGEPNERPEWSPDGTLIAYVSAREGAPDLWVMNTDGSAQTRLSSNGAPITLLAWSPAGTHIAYEQLDASTFDVDIYLANADGSGTAPLVAAPSLDSAPSWSPDGTQIVFQSNPDIASPADIQVINADGSGLTALTTDAAHELIPIWRP